MRVSWNLKHLFVDPLRSQRKKYIKGTTPGGDVKVDVVISDDEWLRACSVPVETYLQSDPAFRTQLKGSPRFHSRHFSICPLTLLPLSQSNGEK